MNYSMDHGSSYADRERKCPRLFFIFFYLFICLLFFFLHISQMLNVSTTKTCEGISIETCHKGGWDAQEKKMTR